MIKSLRKSIKGEKHARSETHSRQSSIASLGYSQGPPTAGQNVASGRVIQAIADYTSLTPQELSFSKGTHFHLMSSDASSGYFEVYDPAKNSRGLVPANYFKSLPQLSKTPSNDYILTHNRGSSRASSTGGSSQKPGFLHAIVKYDFSAENDNELSCKEGESVVIVAQSNDQWLLAKPIGRLGGPGLVPLEYVQVRDLQTGLAVEDVREAIAKARIPQSSEWNRQVADYEASGITLGGFDDNNSQHRHTSSSATSFGGRSSAAVSGTNGVGPAASNSSIVNAGVEKCAFESGQFWYVVVAQTSDGYYRKLCRYYEDFYDLQIALRQAFDTGPNERSPVPSLPGPVVEVTGTIAEERKFYLDEYLRNLISSQQVGESELVRNFFQARQGDIVSEYPTNALPSPPSQDKRPSILKRGQSSSSYLRARSTHSTGDDGHSSTTSSINFGNPLHSSASSSSTHPPAAPVSSSTRQSNGSTYYNNNVKSQQQQQQHPGPINTHLRNASFASAITSSTTDTSSASPVGPSVKVKIAYNAPAYDDIIAMKVAVDISYASLISRVQSRIAEIPNPSLSVRDDYTGAFKVISNDADLRAIMSSQSKLMFYVDDLS